MKVALAWTAALCLLGQNTITLQDFLSSNGKKTLPKAMVEERYQKLSPDMQLKQCVLELCSAKRGTSAYQNARHRLAKLDREKLSVAVSADAREALAIRYLKTGDTELELESLSLPIDGAYGDSYEILLIKRLVHREVPTRSASLQVKSIVRKLKSRMGSVREEIIDEISAFLRTQRQSQFVKSLLRLFSN